MLSPSRHPLTPWLLLLLGVVVVGGVRAARGGLPSHPHAESIERGLARAERAADTRPLLLVLGDSRLHHALPSGPELEVAWGESPPRVARITAAGLSLASLGPYLDRVLELEPRWVAVQAETVLPADRDRSSRLTRLRRRLLAPRIRGPQRTEQHLDKVRGRWEGASFTVRDEDRLAAAEGLARLAGTPLVVLVLPRSPTEQALTGATWMSEQQREVQALLSGPDQVLSLLQVPGLSDEHFHDYVHMNPAGRALTVPVVLSILRDPVD